ncbi:hypothetical protein HY450_00795 [Candidatus Pacearchaeota archaeon]|nr:hypothetical protein [Candidatus Pacearchaeota archaeon]
MEDKPVYLRDIIYCSMIEPKRMSEEEIKRFNDELDREMGGRGFTAANEITARSERMTGKDYMIRVY